MKLDEYKAKREELLAKAHECKDSCDTENMTAIMDQIESLDNEFYAAAVEAANNKALSGEPGIVNIKNMSQPITGGKVVEKMENTIVAEFTADSKEYRAAWLKNLQGKNMSAEDMRAFAVAGSPVPTMTVNAIMDVVRQHAWLMERSTTIYANSKLTYYIEGTTAEAKDHTENAAITPDVDTLVKIDLTPAEICKMVQVSDSASQMSIDVFEGWLADHLGKAIARTINKKIISAAETAAAKVSGAISATTVQTLLGNVKGDDIALVCNNKTLYTKLLPIQDDSKNALVRFDGGLATIYGRAVLLDDNMADNKLLAGDWSKMVCAIAEDINVKRAYDIDTNSYKFLGVSVFDCKVGINAAFSEIAGE